jgi:hypothetical protein
MLRSILSHTWGLEEVTFKDMERNGTSKRGSARSDSAESRLNVTAGNTSALIRVAALYRPTTDRKRRYIPPKTTGFVAQL